MARDYTQRYFDEAFYHFGEHPEMEFYVPRHTRAGYVAQINSLWSSIPDHIKRGLQRRKDRRSLGQFALHIYDNTQRERFLFRQWLKSINRPDVNVKDYGIANDGRLIAETNGESGRADYRLTSAKGTWSLEVKFCPVQNKLTFKVCDLKNYAKANALVLLIMGDTRMIGPNGDPNSDRPLAVPPGLKWALFGRETIRRMLSEFPIKRYKEMGYKPSIQLRGSQIQDTLLTREWNYESVSADVPLVD